MDITSGTDTAALYLQEQRETKRFSAYLGKFCFFAFVFFTMFGTNLPFQARTFDVTEVATSNITTQIVYTGLFLLGLIALMPKYKQVINFMLREKFITLFILFALLSVVWSPFPFVSFKRWFQVAASFIACLAGLFYINSDEDILKFLKPITAIFIIASLGACLSIPGAKDDLGVWRGLAPSKNHLGQVAFFSIMIFSYSILLSKWPGKILSAIIVIISMVLLVQSKSSTAQLAFLIIVMIWCFQFVDNRFKALKVGRFFSTLTIVTLVVFAVVAWNFAGDLIADGFASIGEDMTFTGRTDLWADMIDHASNHIWLGNGYQGFWVLENNQLMHLYQKYIWLPNQSHSGYIDIFVDLGIVGLLILFAIIIKYFISLSKINEHHYWKWIVMGTILMNFQESSFFRQGVFTGNFFTFFVLLLMVRRYRGTIVSHKPAEANVKRYPMKSSPY